MIHHTLLVSGFFALASGQSLAASDATTITSAVSNATPSPTEPCAIASSIQARALQSGGGVPIQAALAQECLQSVPVDKSGDALLIDDLKVYLEWNTDTAYFKDLPEWYDNPSMDFYGELDKIKAAIMSDTYTSEAEVQSAIAAVFAQTGDNHLQWTSDISTVFSFQRTRSLVSVSTDGTKVPAVFDYDDLYALSTGANFSASSITKINGEDVQTYLRKVGQQLALHDAHARYNALFPNQAGTSLGTVVPGKFSDGIYDGPNTTFTYENGTSTTFINIARFQANFAGVDSGQSFFSKFCSGPSSTSASPSSTPTSMNSTVQATPTSTPASSAQAAQQTALLYPPAKMLGPGNAIGGYYLNSSNDVAVLSIPSFEPELKNPDYPSQASSLFQEVAREFIKKASSDGKSQLVIDLRYNGGGITVLGFDLFKLLFPNLEPYQASRRRAHQAFKQLVDVTDDQIDSLQYTLKQNDTEFERANQLWEFSYKLATTPNDTDFESGQQFYGPHAFHNDNFTSLRSWNLSNTFGFASNFSVAGYGGELATPQPAFNASNIVLLQDGACASTCAIFSELMRTVAGVETLVIGGLPDAAIPMQKTGGTRGWLAWPLSKLDSFSGAYYSWGNQAAINAVNGTEIEAMHNTKTIWKRFKAFQVNAADGIRRGDQSETPLQFVYEAAECRIYYTPQMIFDVTKVWKAAADTKWGNRKCNTGRGFGTLATKGDGMNQTSSAGNPGQNTNIAAGFTAPTAMVMAIAVGVTILQL